MECHKCKQECVSYYTVNKSKQRCFECMQITRPLRMILMRIPTGYRPPDMPIGIRYSTATSLYNPVAEEYEMSLTVESFLSCGWALKHIECRDVGKIAPLKVFHLEFRGDCKCLRFIKYTYFKGIRECSHENLLICRNKKQTEYIAKGV